MQNEFIYVEFVNESIKNRNVITTLDQVKASGCESYCSLFQFTDELKYFVEKTKSTKGYIGLHTAKTVVLDFDGADLDAVRNEVVRFIQSMLNDHSVPAEYWRIAFSGNKGFHISLPFDCIGDARPTKDLAKRIKGFVTDLATDFQFVDSSIYQSNRILRLTNSINPKSNLYKIPLTLDELTTLAIEEIRTMAKQPRTVATIPSSKMQIVESLNGMWMKWLDENLQEHSTESHSIHRGHFLEPAGQGNRSNTAVSILGTLINKKVERDLSQEILTLWNKQNTTPLPENELYKIISDFYLRYDKSGSDMTLVYNFKEMAVAYQNHINDLPKRVKLGFPVLDEKIRGIKKGEVMTLIGKTSVGKSAFLQNIAMNFAKYSGEPTLFFSMEMPISSVMERSIQMDMNKSGYEIEAVCSETVGVAEDMAKIIFNKIPSFYCIEESGLTLERIESIIEYAENNIYHKPTALVVIDYLGLIKSKEKNIYERVSEIARELKNLAKRKKTAVITLSQTTKQNDTNSELNLGSARDSGVVDEASDFVIGLWKEKEQSEFDQFNEMQLGILKNRNGFTGTISIKMNRKNLVFSANDKKKKPANDKVSMKE